MTGENQPERLWGDPFQGPTFIEPDEEALRHVLDHPVRLRALSAVTPRPLTAREVGREVGTTAEEATYHLRMLDAAGYVEVTEGEDGEPRYGYCEHWVCRRAVRRRRKGLPEELSHEENVWLNRAMLRASAATVDRRLGESLPEDAEVWLSDIGTWVPRERWEEALQLVRRATVLVHESALPAEEPGAVSASFTVCLFPWWLTDEEKEMLATSRAKIEAELERQDAERAGGADAEASRPGGSGPDQVTGR